MPDRSPVSRLTSPADRRLACPGLFRLAPALDGAICRVKLAGGRLSAGQAQAIAAAAEAFSGAAIELTNRGNFQIRAIQPQHEVPLVEALVAAGLGPQPAASDKGPGDKSSGSGAGGKAASCAIDDPALLGSDDVRNIMLSPMAGRDPLQIIDIEPLADRLLRRLQQDTRYHALSPKFAIQLDAGESVAMLSHPHDLWLSVISADEIAIGLASCMPVAGDPLTPAGDRALAVAPLSTAYDLICGVLNFFLEISAAQPTVTRMKQLPVDVVGAAFVDKLQRRLGFNLKRDADVEAWRRRPMRRGSHLGIIAESAMGHVSLGAMPPLGRLSAAQLTAIADMAETGDGTLRLTPWQSVILPGVAATQAPAMLQQLVTAGLTIDAAAPFAQMIACAGSTGCGSALGATQADGVKLAHLLEAAHKTFSVHLSGCSKSCAAMRAEPATLVAVSPDHYDLYRRQPGAASRFGQRIAENLTIDEAVPLLASLSDQSDDLHRKLT